MGKSVTSGVWSLGMGRSSDRGREMLELQQSKTLRQQQTHDREAELTLSGAKDGKKESEGCRSREMHNKPNAVKPEL